MVVLVFYGKQVSSNSTFLLVMILCVFMSSKRYPFWFCGYPIRTVGVDLGLNLSWVFGVKNS